tara:strand:- start:211 stop:666 length:456 start_codon:yes stop_codon:yes gene_type:complete
MFAADTKIFIPLKRSMSIAEGIEKDQFEVWSYNMTDRRFEIRFAKVKSVGPTTLTKVIINDTPIWMSPEQKLLVQDLSEISYEKMMNVSRDVFIKALRIDDEDVLSDNKLMELTEEVKTEEAYTLEADVNSNFVVVTEYTDEHHSGIIVSS